MVMVPLEILKLSWTTLATGARQFVVQEALEIDVMLRGIVLVVVDAEHDGDVFAVGGSGDDDFFHRPAQMLLCVFGLGEPAGRFNDDLRAHDLPRNRSRIFFLEYLELLAIHGDGVGFGRDSCLRLPRMESYFSKWARVFGSVRSLTATIRSSCRRGRCAGCCARYGQIR